MSKDTIYRQDVINAFDCSIGGVPVESVKYVSEYADKMMSRINALPSAQPERGYSTYDDDVTNFCPNCGAELADPPKTDEKTKFLEKREWIEGCVDRWYRKKFFCPSCGIKIRTESWTEKRCFGVGTILSDNTMPKYCPNCGLKFVLEAEWNES